MRLKNLESSALPLGLPGPNTGILNHFLQESKPMAPGDLSLGLLQLSGRESLPQNPMWRRWQVGSTLPPQATSPMPRHMASLIQMQDSFRDGGIKRGIEELGL